jgi:hypothetical protein
MEDYPDSVAASYLLALKGEAAERFGITFEQGDLARMMKVRVVRIRLPTGDGAPLWFFGTAGRSGRSREHQFIGIYDSDSLVVADMLAAAYHYDVRRATLGVGHTVPFDETSPLRSAGFSNFLTLEGSTYAPFQESSLVVAGVPTTFFAVIPIGPAELELEKTAGLGRLLDSWKQSGRDLIRIGQLAAR